MNVVYIVSKAGEQDTRLILPGTLWSGRMREKLTALGYSVRATDQDPDKCVRDDLERARMEHLFDLAAPL